MEGHLETMGAQEPDTSERKPLQQRCHSSKGRYPQLSGRAAPARLFLFASFLLLISATYLLPRRKSHQAVNIIKEIYWRTQCEER